MTTRQELRQAIVALSILEPKDILELSEYLKQAEMDIEAQWNTHLDQARQSLFTAYKVAQEELLPVLQEKKLNQREFAPLQNILGNSSANLAEQTARLSLKYGENFEQKYKGNALIPTDYKKYQEKKIMHGRFVNLLLKWTKRDTIKKNKECSSGLTFCDRNIAYLRELQEQSDQFRQELEEVRSLRGIAMLAIKIWHEEFRDSTKALHEVLAHPIDEIEQSLSHYIHGGN